MTTSDAETTEESMSLVIDDTVHVAVGKDVGESRLPLKWAGHHRIFLAREFAFFVFTSLLK